MTDLTLQDLKRSIDGLKEHVDKRFDKVDKRFDHVDSELRDIKIKINELIDVSGEGGLQGQKVIKFPDVSDGAEEM